MAWNCLQSTCYATPYVPSNLSPSCGLLTSIQAADAMSGHNHRDRASRHEWKAKRSNQSGSKQSHSATTEDFDVHCLWTALKADSRNAKAGQVKCCVTLRGKKSQCLLGCLGFWKTLSQFLETRGACPSKVEA